MKSKPFVALLFWLTPYLLFANAIYWRGNYKKALKEAKYSNKALGVLVVKKDTPLCNQIIKQQFINQPYIDKLNKRFIFVIVTFEGSNNYPVEIYYTTTFPTLFLVNSKTETFLQKPLYGKEIDGDKLRGIIEKQ